MENPLYSLKRKFYIKCLKAATSSHNTLKKNQCIRIKTPEVSSFVVPSVWSQAGEGVEWRTNSSCLSCEEREECVQRECQSLFCYSGALSKFSETVKGVHTCNLFNKWSATWWKSWDPESARSKCCLLQINSGDRINGSLALAWFLKEGRLVQPACVSPVSSPSVTFNFISQLQTFIRGVSVSKAITFLSVCWNVWARMFC